MRDVKRVVVGTALVAAWAVLLASCGLLLPQRGRENPLDTEGPVAPILSFAAQTQSIDAAAGTASVSLTWALPADRVPATVYLVRNETAQPRNKNDGVGLPAAAADLGYLDDAVEVVPGKVYWYAAWCTVDDVTYVGPVYARASTVVVAPISDFAAVATAADTVQLSWTVPAANAPAGMMVVRKEGSAPANREDGVPVLVTLANGSYGDTVSSDKEYHYAAWTYDDARLRFVGPVAATASTVVPASLTGFAATATSGTQVNLRWTIPTSNPPASLVVVRKENTQPLTSTDGTVVPVTLSSGAHVDSTALAGTVYYYGAWGLNTTGYLSSPVVYDLAKTSFYYLTRFPAVDGYAKESGTFVGASSSLYVGSWSVSYLSILRFSDLPPHALNAKLSLYCPSGGGYTVTAEPVASAWDPATLPYSTASALSFVTGSAIASTTWSGYSSLDVTAAAAAWASGPATNYGIRLRSPTNPLTEFYSNDHPTSTFRPYLSIYCSEEFQ